MTNLIPEAKNIQNKHFFHFVKNGSKIKGSVRKNVMISTLDIMATVVLLSFWRKNHLNGNCVTNQNGHTHQV